MNRTNKSALIAVTSTFNNLLNSLISLIFTSLIIKMYGSDFNGLTSTAGQFINMLMIVEGGFTTAINVALFKPYIENDDYMISKIRRAAETKFKKIGLVFLVIGVMAAIVYTFFIKTEYDYFFVLSILLMSILPTFINIYSSLKWKILFQMEQKDYILNIISSLIVLVTYSINIVIVLFKGVPLVTRFVIMAFSIINIFVVCRLGKQKYKKYDKELTAEPEPNLIKGVNDVFVLNLTGVIYSSFPLLFITASVGTTIASVYSLYNAIFMIIKSIVLSIVRAPTIGIGQIINEDIIRARKVFKSYQFTSFFLIVFFLSVTISLAVPFVSLMTAGNTDINYENTTLLILLSLIFLFENIHVPSGQMIIMSARYKLCKRIQIIALIVIVVCSFIGNMIFGFYGILLSIFLASLVLCLFEVYFNYKYILKESISGYIKLLIISMLIIFINIVLNKFLIIPIDSYFSFIKMGFLFSIINLFTTLIIYNIFFRNECRDILNRFLCLSKSILKSIGKE